MKILFFVGEFNEGGAERVISILANNLVERNFDVEILKYHNTENLYKTNKKIKIYSVEENTKTRKNIIKNLLWMKDYFKNNCDVVISFLAPFNILALLANLFNKTPIIVADRNDPNRVPNSSLLRKIRNVLYRTADAVVVQTNRNKEYFSKSLQKRITVIKNPITMGDNIGLGLNSLKEKLIVSVGRLEEQKNQLLLIEAFNEIHKKYKNHTLVIYGEGSYRKELEHKIKELELEKYISLPGNEKDIFEKISNAELFVLSSNYEGMPNALAEAMCLGLACISTKVSGANELIKDSENGLLIDTGSKEQLVNSIDKLLSNKQLREELANNACNIANELDEKAITDKWQEIICNVIK